MGNPRRICTKCYLNFQKGCHSPVCHLACLDFCFGTHLKVRLSVKKENQAWESDLFDGFLHLPLGAKKLVFEVEDKKMEVDASRVRAVKLQQERNPLYWSGERTRCLIEVRMPCIWADMGSFVFGKPPKVLTQRTSSS